MIVIGHLSQDWILIQDKCSNKKNEVKLGMSFNANELKDERKRRIVVKWCWRGGVNVLDLFLNSQYFTYWKGSSYLLIISI